MGGEASDILIGPAGWSYPDWKTTVFAGLSPAPDPLVFMSRLFDVIELNSSFYRMPSLRHVDTWLSKVEKNPAFLFTVKLYRAFTHDPASLSRQEGKTMSEVLLRFHEAGRLGAALAQFPYRFHNTKANRQYLSRLRSLFPDVPMVVELRHRSWLHRAVTAFLSEIGLGFCNIDQPQVSFSLPLTDIVTTPSVSYLRCHGRNAAHWFDPGGNRDTRYFYRYGKEELREIATVARGLADRAETLFVIFNNHFMGNEVFDAMVLSEMLGKSGKPWPPWWPGNTGKEVQPCT